MKIKPELKKNILNFGYRINYTYEGMLAHSFDRFYVVTKFILPSIGELQFSKLNHDNTCAYLDNKNTYNTETRKHMLDLVMICKVVWGQGLIYHCHILLFVIFIVHICTSCLLFSIVLFLYVSRGLYGLIYYTYVFLFLSSMYYNYYSLVSQYILPYLT